MKKFNMILALILGAQAAFAGVITDDNLDLGKPSSAATKSLTFKGPTKKKLSSTAAGSLGYDGNTLSLGDGTNTTNKLFEFNKGGTNPFWKYDFATGEMQSGNATAINHGANSLSLGDGTNSNKVLKFNKGASSPEIRYNSGTGKLQFSNDTVSYKDIGSGSGGGGGTNLLQDSNSDFEAGSPPQNWTASGGTFITETANPLFGLQSGSWDSSASAQTLSSALVTIEKGFIGKRCTADIEYKWASGVAGDLSFQVVNQVPNILATVNLDPTTGSNTRKAFLAFDCPTTATDQLRVRLLSNVANPALILIDNAFVGVNKSTVDMSRTSLMVHAYYESTTGCAWSRTSASFGAFSTSAACPALQVASSEVSVNTTDVDLPVLRFNEALRPGKYVLKATFTTNASAASPATGYRIVDVNSVASILGQSAHCGSQNATNAETSQVTCIASFTLLAAGTPSFEMQGFAASGNVLIYNDTDDTNFVWEMVKYPISPGEALNLETTGWFIDANIGGADFSFNSIASTYTAMESPSLDMVVNKAKGSISNVEIPCSTTNPSTGLTCAAGSEQIGAAFTPPYAGTYEVCTDFYMSTATSNVTAFQLVETPNNAQTILQEGGQRTGQANQVDANMHVCGTFKFDSVSKRTIRLMFESPDTNSRIIAIGRGGTIGQRDLKLTVRPITQNFPMPVFTDLTNSLNKKVESDGNNQRIESVYMTNNGTTCNSVNQSGNWIASCTRNAAGNVTVNFTGGIWPSAPPRCIVTNYVAGGIGDQVLSRIASVTTSAVNVWTSLRPSGGGSVSAGADYEFFMICMGPK